MGAKEMELLISIFGNFFIVATFTILILREITINSLRVPVYRVVSSYETIKCEIGRKRRSTDCRVYACDIHQPSQSQIIGINI